MEKTKFILVLSVSKTSRSSNVKCYAFFQNGDELFEFLIQCPFQIAAPPGHLEDKYYSSSQAAKVSDCYFCALKYLMDNFANIFLFLGQIVN